MQKFDVEGHESSILPDVKCRLVCSDEFDGDTSGDSDVELCTTGIRPIPTKV